MRGLWLVLWVTASGLAQAADGMVSSPEPGWSQWRGPRRDGVSEEKNLLPAWPEGGPTRLWTSGDIGRGYSSPIVVRDRLFITGDVGDDLVIFALDLEGREIWRAKNGAAWKSPYPGARATCAYSAGNVYHLNAHGRLACLQADNGREIWAVDIMDRFGGKNITWALSEGVIVDGERVMVTAGGEKALLAALDKKNGETRWQSGPLRMGTSRHAQIKPLPEPIGEADGPSYASMILFEKGGRRILAGASLRHQFGADAETGALLWARPMKTTYSVIAATPALSGDLVFGTAPDGDGGLALRIAVPKNGSGTVEATEAWRSELDTCQGALISHGDVIYGPWYRGKRGWVCLDAATGKVRFDTREVAIGSAIFADGALIALGQDGEAALLRPSVDRFLIAGRFPLTERRVNDAWAHPVLWQGRLYLRYHQTLSCFSVSAPAQQASP